MTIYKLFLKQGERVGSWLCPAESAIGAILSTMALVGLGVEITGWDLD